MKTIIIFLLLVSTAFAMDKIIGDNQDTYVVPSKWAMEHQYKGRSFAVLTLYARFDPKKESIDYMGLFVVSEPVEIIGGPVKFDHVMHDYADGCLIYTEDLKPLGFINFGTVYESKSVNISF